jgi:integrase
MPSLTKDSRARSPYWICCYSAADGRQLKRSTKQTEKEKAWEVCLAFSRAESLARAGEATASQLRRVFNETLYRVGAESLQRPSVREWLSDWLSGRKGVATHGTMQKYRQVVEGFLAFLGRKADAKLESLIQGDFIRFRDSLLAEGRTPQTVDGLVRKVLNAPFSLALRMGIIAVNPVAALPPLRTVKAPKGVFSPEQMDRLVAAAEGDWKGVILSGYYTGARLQDLVSLRWRNVDLARGAINFEQSKTGTVVITAINSNLQDHLLTLPAPDSLEAYVFPTLAGKSGSGRSGLSMEFKRIMAAAKIDAGCARKRRGAKGRNLSVLSFHSLRHTFNSALANGDVPLEIRQKLTGHATAAMNAHYTHHELETIRRAVETIPPIGSKAIWVNS